MAFGVIKRVRYIYIEGEGDSVSESGREGENGVEGEREHQSE